MPQITLHPIDYTLKKILFCNPNTSFVVPSREGWWQSEVNVEVFDISVDTDVSFKLKITRMVLLTQKNIFQSINLPIQPFSKLNLLAFLWLTCF